jgi:hypothetical protein
LQELLAQLPLTVVGGSSLESIDDEEILPLERFAYDEGIPKDV